jgi:hypothetical protein
MNFGLPQKKLRKALEHAPIWEEEGSSSAKVLVGEHARPKSEKWYCPECSWRCADEHGERERHDEPRREANRGGRLFTPHSAVHLPQPDGRQEIQTQQGDRSGYGEPHGKRRGESEQGHESADAARD